MAAIDLNLNPSHRQLRQFGAIALFALPALGWLFAGKPTPSSWDASHTQQIGIMTAVGLTFAICAWLRPSLLKWVFIAVSVVTFPIGFVIGEILIGAIFVIAFLPLAIWFRMIKRDALQRQLDEKTDTYWETKQQPSDRTSYYRQS